jgi:hypothetical protein
MNSVHGILASQVALDVSATGINLTVNQRETSFEVALLQASNMLNWGRADLVVVGGADELSPLTAELGTRLHLAQTGEDTVFDPQAENSTTVAGEGAAMFVASRAESDYKAIAYADNIWQARKPKKSANADIQTNNRDGTVASANAHSQPGINHSGYWGTFPSSGALQFAANLLMLQEARVFAPVPAPAPDIRPQSISHLAASTHGSYAGYVLKSTA